MLKLVITLRSSFNCILIMRWPLKTVRDLLKGKLNKPIPFGQLSRSVHMSSFICSALITPTMLLFLGPFQTRLLKTYINEGNKNI